jgi:uncharacterized membrane protein
MSIGFLIGAVANVVIGFVTGETIWFEAATVCFVASMVFGSGEK